MDVKQLFKSKTLLIFCVLFGFIGCQKKDKEKAKTKVIDNDNSQYAGKKCYGETIEDQYVLKWSDGEFSLFRGSKADLEKLIESQKEPNLKTLIAVEQNRKFKIDEKFKNEERLNSVATEYLQAPWYTWGQEDIQVGELWGKNFLGTGVVVAVVDGGVDQDHPSLINRIYTNENEIANNGIDDDQNGLIDDYSGFDFSSKSPKGVISSHGTHVAGIIASEPKDSPMFGLAPESKIIPISIFGGEESGTLVTAVFALKYAESRGAKIVNASWGGPICSELLRDAILSLADKDILFVSASGNDGTNIDIEPEYPAAFNLINQITVGATMPSGLMAAFSNYGYNRVHVLAPGDQILSTVSEGWDVKSGTSMAAPFVSGLAALLWGAHPEAKSAQIKSAILQSVKEPKSYNPVVAKGRINALMALEKLEIILKETNNN